MGPTAIPPMRVDPDKTSVLQGLAGIVGARLPSEADTPAVRLELLGTHPDARPTMLDGAWWPRSRDLLEELPSLIAEVQRQGGHVSRVSYHPDTWEPAPRTVTVDGDTVKLGWFRSMDPHVLTLTGVYGAGRLDLLVVPPESLAVPAQRLMDAAAEPDNRQTASAVLLASAGVPPVNSGPWSPSRMP
jgi:hypothetical protein